VVYRHSGIPLYGGYTVCKYLEVRPSPDRSSPDPRVEKDSDQGTFAEHTDTVPTTEAGQCTTHSSQQIPSLSALARAHHRTTIGTARTGAPTSAANLGLPQGQATKRSDQPESSDSQTASQSPHTYSY
jgi:hypothetical protein